MASSRATFILQHPIPQTVASKKRGLRRNTTIPPGQFLSVLDVASTSSTFPVPPERMDTAKKYYLHDGANFPKYFGACVDPAADGVELHICLGYFTESEWHSVLLGFENPADSKSVNLTQMGQFINYNITQLLGQLRMKSYTAKTEQPDLSDICTFSDYTLHYNLINSYHSITIAHSPTALTQEYPCPDNLTSMFIKFDMTGHERSRHLPAIIISMLYNAFTRLRDMWPGVFDPAYLAQVSDSCRTLTQTTSALSNILQNRLNATDEPTTRVLMDHGYSLPQADQIRAALTGDKPAITNILYTQARRNLAARVKQPLDWPFFMTNVLD